MSNTHSTHVGLSFANDFKLSLHGGTDQFVGGELCKVQGRGEFSYAPRGFQRIQPGESSSSPPNTLNNANGADLLLIHGFTFRVKARLGASACLFSRCLAGECRFWVNHRSRNSPTTGKWSDASDLGTHILNASIASPFEIQI